MKKYIGKRLLQLLPVLLGVTFLSFAMMRAAGSDAIIELYGDKGAVAQEIIDAKRAELGLDQPFLVQYSAWLRGLLTGDMGVSYVSGKNVFDTFASKLPATLLLTALSIVATVVISIPLGIWAAVRQDRFVDYFLRFFSFIGNSLPNFFVALLLFVGLPIPGTGAWTGTLAASFLDMGFKSTSAAVSLGVVLAGIIMGAVSLTGVHVFGL